MKIVFMGTPPFAVASLQKLAQNGHQIVSVVTVPDKPQGRGQRVRHSAVKEAALQLGVPVLQPDDLREPAFVNELKNLKADLFVVVAFRILPAEVFEIPPNGTINLHSSLLPKYRGAAPINWAIINGETSTGVSTILIQKQVDAGDLILQDEVAIADDETAGMLHDRLAEVGAELLVKTVDLIDRGEAPRNHQTGAVTLAPKITREICRINWQEPAFKIRNLVRGLNPTPGAFTFLNGKLIKLYNVSVEGVTSESQPGTIIEANGKNGRLVVATGKKNLLVHEVQPEGKRKMSAADFLLGNKLNAGERFE